MNPATLQRFGQKYPVEESNLFMLTYQVSALTGWLTGQKGQLRLWPQFCWLSGVYTGSYLTPISRSHKTVPSSNCRCQTLTGLLPKEDYASALPRQERSALRPGLEPKLRGSEPLVLPLHHRRLKPATLAGITLQLVELVVKRGPDGSASYAYGLFGVKMWLESNQHSSAVFQR